MAYFLVKSVGAPCQCLAAHSMYLFCSFPQVLFCSFGGYSDGWKIGPILTKYDLVYLRVYASAQEALASLSRNLNFYST